MSTILRSTNVRVDLRHARTTQQVNEKTHKITKKNFHTRSGGIDFSAGKWWRWSTYEVRDGIIRPGPEAVLEEYSPWNVYRESLDERCNPPYLSLLVLVEDLSFDEGFSPLDHQNFVTDWCRRYGLFGLLPHRTKMAVLQPRWEP